jgi:hypothetical protein
MAARRRRTRSPARNPQRESTDPRGFQRIRQLRITDSVHSLAVLDDEDALEQAALYHIEQAENAKWPRVLEWFQNYAALCGNPYAHFTWVGGSLQMENPTLPVPMDVVTPRTVENLLIEPYQVNVSMFTEADPEPTVPPNSDHSDDIDAAAIAATALDVLWERPLCMPEKLRTLGGLLTWCGTASHETEYGDTGMYQPPSRSGRRAKLVPSLKANVYSGIELIPDPTARDTHDSLSWIGRQSFEDQSWIEENFMRPPRDAAGTYYPKRVREMGTTDGTRSTLYWWERIRDVLDSPDFAGTLSGASYAIGHSISAHQCLFHVLDVRPNVYYPEGRTIIIAGGKLIYQGPARAWSEDYPERWHPHSLYRYWRVPGRFWGYPPFSALRPLQNRVNAIDALVQLNREYMTIGQWLLPSACKVDESEVTGIPGKAIRYRSNPMNSKPEKVQHEPLPQELLGERALCAAAIYRIGGVQQLGKEVAPSGLRAGSMLQYLDRLSKSAKSAMLQDFNDSMERSGEQILMEVSLRMRANDPSITGRIRAAARGRSELAIRSFTGKDLRQNVHVRMDIRSRLLRNPEAERELAIQWMQFAGQEGASSPEERAYMLRKAGFEDFERTQSPHVDRANRMLDRLSDGTFAPFLKNPQALMLPVDDPNIFAQVIANRMLEDRFTDNPPQVKAAIFLLLDLYQQAAQAAAAAAQNAQMRMQLIGGIIQNGKVPELLKLLQGDDLLELASGEDDDDGERESGGGDTETKKAA